MTQKKQNVFLLLVVGLLLLAIGAAIALAVTNNNLANQLKDKNTTSNANTTTDTTSNTTTTDTTTDTTTKNPPTDTTTQKLPPAVEQINYTIISKTDKENTAAYEIDVTYPEMINYPTAATQTNFNQMVSDSILQYSKDVKFTDPTAGKNTLTLKYTVNYQTNKYVSLMITGDEYLGGAHPDPIVIAINFDLTGNKKFELADLFTSGSDYITKISQLTIADLTTRFGADFTPAGVSANGNNFQHFNFNEDSLKITFDAYQAGPYAMGTPEVTIPLSELSGYLRAEFK